MCAAAFRCKVRETLKKKEILKVTFLFCEKQRARQGQSTRNNSSGKKSRFGLNWARARHGGKRTTQTRASRIRAWADR